MALYKQLEDNSWLKAEIEVYLPDNRIITQENQIEGWVWNNEDPIEYLEWVKLQENQITIEK